MSGRLVTGVDFDPSTARDPMKVANQGLVPILGTKSDVVDLREETTDKVSAALRDLRAGVDALAVALQEVSAGAKRSA